MRPNQTQAKGKFHFIVSLKINISITTSNISIINYRVYKGDVKKYVENNSTYNIGKW
jgi:hypothetical protein